MRTKLTLTMGEDTFTLLDLLRKAAAHKGLEFHEGAQKAYSKPIKVYELDQRLLDALKDRGFRLEDRPDCRYEIFTIVDTKSPRDLGGNYWNFSRLKADKIKFDLRVGLVIGFGLNIEKRGVTLVPRTHGSFLCPASDRPHFRMFKALVESDDNAPAVAREIAQSEGTIVVTWTDLGLGGIRRIADLFAEFAGNREMVRDLCHRADIFDPMPYQRYEQPGEELFIAEPAQPKVFQAWRAQLSEYRESLVA